MRVYLEYFVNFMVVLCFFFVKWCSWKTFLLHKYQVSATSSVSAFSPLTCYFLPVASVFKPCCLHVKVFQNTAFGSTLELWRWNYTASIGCIVWSKSVWHEQSHAVISCTWKAEEGKMWVGCAQTKENVLILASWWTERLLVTLASQRQMEHQIDSFAAVLTNWKEPNSKNNKNKNKKQPKG